VADRKPVLGICRGIQTINVACGGTLYQDINAQNPRAIKHDYFSGLASGYSRDYLAHSIQVGPGSHLARLLDTDHCQVNSMHHQGIKRLAPGLIATAFAPDGLIEGVEMADRFVVGVQWHPEELLEVHPWMQRLFAGFIAAAKARIS
jgi:putative glutamine amidotransferase